MRKLFTLSIAVLLSVFSINAQYVMKVTLKNGQEKEFDTSEIENIIWPENEDAPETHEWVDLGLPSGTKWATCNVGANSPEEYGDYYAWGETETKKSYDEASYSLYDSQSGNYKDIGLDISGTEYDVAHVKWGDEWRMPTYADWTELMEYCSYEWATKSGINGYVITSNSNGNEIFLPAAGYKTDNSTSNVGKMGFYWSSLFDESEPPCAWRIGFGSEGFGRMNGNRCDGQSVRPVLSGSNPTEIKVTSIILGESSLSLTVGDASTISASVEPSDATDKSLSWSSSDPSVATVDASGMVSAIKAGTTTITVTANDGSGVKATCTVTVTAASEETEGEHNGHKYVDLGLPSGTKWATCNVGASSPEEYGDYYAWGETETKSVYSEASYKFFTGTDIDGDGRIDEKFNVIDIGSNISGSEYDVAHVKWGGEWQMPTCAQCEELVACCSTSETSVNGVWGTKVIGPNGNSIFLPAAGYRWDDYRGNAGMSGCYWLGTLFDYNDYSAYGLIACGSPYWHDYYRDEGRSVRPVWSESVTVTDISFDKLSLSLSVDDSYRLTATVSPSDATDKSLIWSSSDPSVATVDASGMVSAIKAGATAVTATANDGSGVTATCTVTVAAASEETEGEHNGHKYVDLGLPSGTKWATCNVGASSPEEYGDYYAWGETESKECYDETFYSLYDSQSGNYKDVGLDIRGTEYDVAHVRWGGSWRMPTPEQCRELMDYCTTSWTSVNGVRGTKVVGPNCKSIFLPAAGFRWDDNLDDAGFSGYYWSGLLGGYDDFYAYSLDASGDLHGRNIFYRDYGLSVRPVCQ